MKKGTDQYHLRMSWEEPGGNIVQAGESVTVTYLGPGKSPQDALALQFAIARQGPLQEPAIQKQTDTVALR